jgi:hypothetical protein
MMNSKRMIAFIFVAIAITLGPKFGHCQDASQTNEIKSIEGEVVDIDYIKQVIVVKWLMQEPQITYQETVFLVNPSAKIIKGTDKVGFMDINKFDRVTVKYIDKGASPPEAIGITIMNNI